MEMLLCPKCDSSNTMGQSDDLEGRVNYRFRFCINCDYYADESNREKDMIFRLSIRKDIQNRYEEAGGDIELERILGIPTDKEKIIDLSEFVNKIKGLPISVKEKYGTQIGTLIGTLRKLD